MEPDYKMLLKSYQLSNTKARQQILSCLYSTGEPVSGATLEELLLDECDRSTIYRNLGALTKAGVVHQIRLNGESRYKIHPVLTDQGIDKEHPHFECKSCGRLFCIDVEIPDPVLPEGFESEENSFVIYGYCRKCNRR